MFRFIFEYMKIGQKYKLKFRQMVFELEFYFCLGNDNIKISVDNFILKLATFSASAQQLSSIEYLPTISRTRIASACTFPNRPPRAFVLYAFFANKRLISIITFVAFSILSTETYSNLP